MYSECMQQFETLKNVIWLRSLLYYVLTRRVPKPELQAFEVSCIQVNRDKVFKRPILTTHSCSKNYLSQIL